MGAPVDAQLSLTNEDAILHLSGHLDFHDESKLREYMDLLLLLCERRALNIDLAEVSSLDSVILGEFLRVRHRAKSATLPLFLVGARGAARDVLDEAGFLWLFACKEEPSSRQGDPEKSVGTDRLAPRN